MRFGQLKRNRRDADVLLFRDMMIACAGRDALAIGGCYAIAHWTRAVLELGDATGFDPELPIEA